MTTVTHDDYVYQDPMDTRVKGILYDLWNQAATDLNLTSSIEVVPEWRVMLEYLKENRSDVILQRMDWGLVDGENSAM